MTTDIEAAVRAFIVENFLFGDGSADLPATRSLIDEGLIDSTGVLELVSFIEEHFGVKVADSEITPENLDSISNIARFVGGRLAATVAA